MSDDTATPARQFIYFADPMCSWCYGFSPVIQSLADHFGARMPVRVVMGGLRPGTTQAMRPEDKAYIRNAWTRVHEATGQPFDHAFFEREGFVYDTEPACRAVVAMRGLAPAAALAFLGRVSRAFYAENRDTTDGEVLADIAAEAGQDRDVFKQAFLAPDTRNETFRDFLFSQQTGVQGFPCLVAGSDDDGYALVANGYRPPDGLIETIEEWLKEGAPTRVTGASGAGAG